MKEVEERRMAETLQRRLREVREKRRMSIKELAEASGLSVSQLYRLEKGERPRVAAITLAHIARALNTSLDYLVGLKDE